MKCYNKHNNNNMTTNILILVSIFVLLVQTCSSFTICQVGTNKGTITFTASNHVTTTVLMSKVRRGRLLNEVDTPTTTSVDDIIDNNSQSKKLSSSSKKTVSSSSSSSLSNKKQQQQEQTSGKKISQDLATWLSNKQQLQQQTNNDNDDEEDINNVTLEVSASETATEYKTFQNDEEEKVSKKSKSKSIITTTEETTNTVERTVYIQSIITDLMTTIEQSNNNLNDILSQLQRFSFNNNQYKSIPIQQLLVTSKQRKKTTDVENDTKTSSTGNTNNNYRLVWVGSDDSICQVGTGLHKVPLARLQEMFLSFTTSTANPNVKTTKNNRLLIREVISIFGPFPNVCNQLQGTITVVPSSSSVSNENNNNENIRIVWDSMIDGTGKELLAGKIDNTRIVNLNVLYSDDNILLLVIPPAISDNNDSVTTTNNSGKSFGQQQQQQKDNKKNKQQNTAMSTILQRTDAFEDNGKRILVFIKENDMDSKLESLRVL